MACGRVLNPTLFALAWCAAGVLLLRRIWDNKLGPAGGAALATMLQANTTLTYLEYVHPGVRQYEPVV